MSDLSIGEMRPAYAGWRFAQFGCVGAKRGTSATNASVRFGLPIAVSLHSPFFGYRETEGSPLFIASIASAF